MQRFVEADGLVELSWALEPERHRVAQAERGREYVQIRAGRFAGAFSERSDGVLAVGLEFWGSALRARCARLRSYVVFSVVRAEEPAICGALESCAFGVERAALERIEAHLYRGQEPAWVENRAPETALLDPSDRHPRATPGSSPRSPQLSAARRAPRSVCR
jgi:hypothetical protein